MENLQEDIMNIQLQYEAKIRPEIEYFAEKVSIAIESNQFIKQYDKGWRVFFSPVVHKPKVLLISINPGAGQSGTKDFGFWDGSEIFEYTNPEYSFSLARETNAVFNQAGLAEVLKNSTVKTNYFFLSATYEKDLYRITDYLGRVVNETIERLGELVFTKSAEWTRQLIKLIQPEVIVCEGKGAYDNVISLFHNFGEYNWKEGCGYATVTDEKLVIIGYSRRFSIIRNKPALIELLKQFVQP